MQWIKRFLRNIGPGLISGSADDDPTGIATYAQSGGKFGYQLLWTTLFTTPFMIVIQNMCGRIGLVTGKNLATILRTYYHPAILYCVAILLTIINLVTLGADIKVMAVAGQLLFPIPFFIWAGIFTLIALILQIFVSYKIYANILKYVTIVLLAYVINAFLVQQNWLKILYYTFIPSIQFTKDYVITLLAIIGGNISPYLFFWQEGLEVEEDVEKRKIVDFDKGKPHIKKSDVHRVQSDTSIGMIFSNSIFYFIELSTAATLHIHGITSIDTASQAASALLPIAGRFAFLLFSIGLLASGFLAIPALSTSSAYVACRTFQWEVGLSKTFFQAPLFYSYIAVFTLVAVIVTLFPIQPFRLLVYAAALNSILTPIILMCIVAVANNKRIMGEFINSFWANILSVAVIILTGITIGILMYVLFI